MTEQILIGKIKPSPYQPRLTFDLEDIRGSIMKDGILVALTVREKDGFYELVDGERRLRLAKQLGYETVKCDVIDVSDEVARRMVYKVNKERKNYTPEEEARFFKRLVEEEGMKPYEIEIQLNVDHHWVQTCLNIWKFPKDIQENVFGLGDRPIAYRFYMSDIRELEPDINRNIETAIEMARQIIKQRMTVDEKKAFIGRRRKKIEEETVKKAQDAIEKVAPELKEPESAEELEKAAEALKKEAKKRKSKEQILEEKRKKAENALMNGRGNALSKVENLKKLGVDTTEFEKKIKKIKAKIFDDPDVSYEEIQKLKKDVDKAKKAEEKRREEEKRKKREEEIRKQAEEEVRAKLMQDKKFLREAAKAGENIESFPDETEAVPLKTIPLSNELQRRIEETQQKIAKTMNDPEVKKRGKLFRNWLSHQNISQSLATLSCPVCGADYTNLVWKCHDLTILEATERVRNEYQASILSREDEE